MIRRVTVAFIITAVVSTAQIGPSGGRIVGGPVGGGFGSVVFPGTGVPRGNPAIGSGHIQGLSNSIRGIPPATGRPGGYRGGGYIVPVPVVVGGYGYGYGYSGYTQPVQPNVTVVNAPQPSPTVIINQNYAPETARPVLREYNQDSSGNPDPTVSSYQAPVPAVPEPVKPRIVRTVASDKPTIYLIAMKDGTVYSAYAYWIEGDTLHYVTTKHAMNMASVSLVDATVTNQLNQERGVEFKLASN
ncbi:MAG: hypothetical protein IT168_04700 [Bryobacterales bacterium]|nr:hypothetical protein [Bryobacterales bacterium]